MGALVKFPVDRTRLPDPPTRDQLRSSRKHAVRPATENVHRLTKRDLEEGKVHLRLLAADGVVVERPKTRGDCENGERPCPWVGCRHHLYLTVQPGTDNIQFTFPDREPDEMPHSCSLDVADEGGLTLDETGVVLNVTRERIRQIGDKVIARIRKYKADNLATFVDEDPEKLDRSAPMGHGGRLGEGGLADQAAADDELDEPAAYVSAKVWPENIYECSPEHDAAAGRRVWSAYIRDSHSRGITPDEFSTKRKESSMSSVKDRVLETLKTAGPMGVAALAAQLDVTPSAVYQACVKMRGGELVVTGPRNATVWALSGMPAASPSAAAPKPKKASGTKPLAAATVTASHGGEDAAKSALLVMRAKAQAKVDAIDEVLASLGAS